MGIKDLHKFIADKFPQIPEAVPVSSFKGYRIAVDSYGVGYILMAVIRSRYIWSRDVIAHPLDMTELETPWLKAFFEYFLPWLKVGITPVFVFDGPNKGIKTQKMEADRAAKEAKKAELEGIMQTAKTNAWKTDQEMLDRARKLLVSLNHIPSAQIETLKNILQSMKFPVVQAPGDGETICSALCKAGYVAAVFSADGDNLAHGCPMLIRDKADMLKREVAGMTMEEDAFSIVRIAKILDTMELTQSQFTDFCIMCGCDYNERIFNVGPVKSLGYIKQYGCIERIPIDTRVLNYHVCRQEFNTVINLKELEIDAPGALDVKGWDSISSECMASYNLETLIADFRTYIQRLPPPRNFHHPQSLVRFVVGDFDQLDGIVPLPNQEKKSKYASKRNGKKKEKEVADWQKLPVFSIPNAELPSTFHGMQAVQTTTYNQSMDSYLARPSMIYPQAYSQAASSSSSRFVFEDDTPSSSSSSQVAPYRPQSIPLQFPTYDYNYSPQTPSVNVQNVQTYPTGNSSQVYFTQF